MISSRAVQDSFQSLRLLRRPFPGRSALSIRVKALPPPQPIFSMDFGSKDLTNGYSVTRRRFPAADFGGQDGARLGMPAGAAASVDASVDSLDDAMSSTAASTWVEAECLALEASLEDLVQSLGNDHFGPDMGQHMQHGIY